MSFNSILFNKPEESPIEEKVEEPAFFTDLNLDQIIDVITAGKKEYNLKPFFYTPLSDADSIYYRHRVMQDLENKRLFNSIKSFAEKMQEVYRLLSLVDKLEYKYNKEGWFLEAVEVYCDAITSLANDLKTIDLRSEGFLAFREYLIDYSESDYFTSLQDGMKRLKNDLSKIKYYLHINGGRVSVYKYGSEIDYSSKVEKIFEKFKETDAKDYRIKIPTWIGMGHVEAKIIDCVARFYPEIFAALDDYYENNGNFIDEKIRNFDREVQFYVAYLEYIEMFKQAGLKFCYPRVSKDKEIYDYEGFDLALARKCIREGSTVVCNDFYLENGERIIVVTGPNQGGKTTFARTFGQLHYLASLGCPVPGSRARLFLFDNIFTHFEREESIQDLRGKLEDDLMRIHKILTQATSDSIIIMNEIFASTATTDAIFLAKKVLEKIIQMDAIAIYVTFLDELASLNEKIVSMVATVSPKDPSIRTYKIVRKPADGLAYAISVAKKYHLTYDDLKERIRSHDYSKERAKS